MVEQQKVMLTSTQRLMVERVAIDLPRFTPGELEGCRRHRAETPLASCVNLANPATGSGSLDALFAREPALANKTNGLRLMYASAGGHLVPSTSSHALSVEGLSRWLSTKPPRRRRRRHIPCWVLTVRDPVARFRSAFRESYLNGTRLVYSLRSTVPYKRDRTAARLVEALRNASSRTSFLYQHSAGRPDWGFLVSFTALRVYCLNWVVMDDSSRGGLKMRRTC